MFSALLYIGILILIHLFAYKLESLLIAKGKWLSFGGGVSVSFVFIHLPPDLLVGGSIGYLYEMLNEYLPSVLAFLGGGIFINILKEEMHEKKENHLGAFLIGAVLFGLVLSV